MKPMFELDSEKEIETIVMHELKQDCRIQGYWAGVNQAINLLNTYETVLVDKTQLYKDLMNLRPTMLKD